MISAFYFKCYKGPDPLLLDWASAPAPFWWKRVLWATTDRVSSLHLCPSPPLSLPQGKRVLLGACA